MGDSDHIRLQNLPGEVGPAQCQDSHEEHSGYLPAEDSAEVEEWETDMAHHLLMVHRAVVE